VTSTLELAGNARTKRTVRPPWEASSPRAARTSRST